MTGNISKADNRKTVMKRFLIIEAVLAIAIIVTFLLPKQSCVVTPDGVCPSGWQALSWMLLAPIFVGLNIFGVLAIIKAKK